MGWKLNVLSVSPAVATRATTLAIAVTKMTIPSHRMELATMKVVTSKM